MKTNAFLPAIIGIALLLPANGQSLYQQPKQKTNTSIASASPTAQQEKLKTSEETKETHKYKQEELTMQEFTLLADFLFKQAQQLRASCQGKSPEETKRLSALAQKFDEQAFHKQIEASEISLKLCKKTSLQNTAQITRLIAEFNGEKKTLIEAYTLLLSSEKDLLKAQEIRQTAKSLTQLAAVAGTLSEAEEKETLALNKQYEVILMLSSNTLR
jgi:hypothetical protein